MPKSAIQLQHSVQPPHAARRGWSGTGTHTGREGPLVRSPVARRFVQGDSWRLPESPRTNPSTRLRRPVPLRGTRDYVAGTRSPIKSNRNRGSHSYMYRSIMRVSAGREAITSFFALGLSLS
jgi:hypothetical protein